MTVMDVRGFGRQRGDKDEVVDQETIRFLPKTKLEVIVKDWDVDRTMAVISESARTGNIGDGKIIVLEASAAMRIRTGEKGVYAM
jgi:nitrogen regulatory protein P-II 1